jgi:CDP-glucose 4,6-dehydratase
MSPSFFDNQFGGVYRDRRVLVTGHTGFKGSWLALWLRQLGAQVTGLALPAEPGPNHLETLEFALPQALVDLRDPVAVQRAVNDFRPELVFHLAAQPLVRLSYREPVRTFGTNVMGLVNLLEAIRASGTVRAVVNATTDKCYANLHTARGYTEHDALGGHDPYSASKACAEIVSASYRASFLALAETPIGLATARAGNVIGGGDWSEDRLVPDLVRAALAGRATAIRHPGATRPWQHVLEPLSGYLLLGQRLLADPRDAAEAWNFGPAIGDHVSVGELARRFASHWDEVHVEADSRVQPHEAALLHLDCHKARRQLGWQPVWSADVAVARTAHWYRRFHREAIVATGDDLRQYAADARRAGLPWALGASATAMAGAA